MKITVIKMTDDRQVAVRAEQLVGDFETFFMFAVRLGVDADFEELSQDFMSGTDRTYIIGV